MLARFLHLADVHLGTLHYGSKARARDFGVTLQSVADYATNQSVDFVLIAGDLFDKAAIDAATHDEAWSFLRTLQRARIPVVVTEGNHDHPRNREDKSWLASFADKQLLHYLEAGFVAVPDGGGQLRCSLIPEGSADGYAGYVDLDGVRIAGSRYLGMVLPRACQAVADAIQNLPQGDTRYTIFMVHGGVEGVIPSYRAELQRADLACLEPAVDYLALGHIHKPFTNLELDAPSTRGKLNWARTRAQRELDLLNGDEKEHREVSRGWVFNPGSLDCWRMDEADWRHGFYDVQIDLSAPDRHRVRHVNVQRRRIVVIRQSVAECASQSDLDQAILRSLEARRDSRGTDDEYVLADEAPIVHLVLEDVLRFDRRHLDLSALEALAQRVFEPLVVDIKNQTRSLQYSEIDTRVGAAPLDRRALEQQVIEGLLGDDVRLAPYRERLAGLALELKERVLAGQAEEQLADQLLSGYRETVGRDG